MRPPIVFLNVGVKNTLMRQMLLSDNSFMNTKFVDLTELYKLGFHKKIVTQKHLGDQGVCHTNIEKFYQRTHFSIASKHTRNVSNEDIKTKIANCILRSFGKMR